MLEKSTSEARRTLAETVDLVLKGETTVLTRDTVPVVPIADLVRIQARVAEGDGRKKNGGRRR